MRKITKSVVLAALSALLVFGCKNSVSGGEKDLNDDVSLENGKKDGNDDASLESGKKDEDDDIPFESGKYITAKGTADGIKITFANNVRIKPYYPIYVDGIPIKIDTTDADVSSDRKEYVFPFAKKGETYVVTYDGELTVNGVDKRVKESVQCVAGGGLQYTECLDIDALDNNYTLTVSYNGPDNSGALFSGTFKPSFAKEAVIKNDSIFENFTFDFHVVLGGVEWENAAYWVYAHDVGWNSSIIKNPEAFSKGFDFVSGDREAPTEQDWREHDYMYAAYATPGFTLHSYSDTTFKLTKDLWSTQQTYTPSN